MVDRRSFLAGLVALGACSASESGGSPSSTSASATTGTAATLDPTEPVDDLGTLAGRPSVEPVAAPEIDLASEAFALGVASGDPDADSVVLWTRLVGASLPDSFELAWDVAADEAFNHIVISNLTTVRADQAHSAHVLVTGLGPHVRLWFRFRAGDQVSATGRSRTLWVPDQAPSSVSIGVANCQLRDAGWWSAHEDMAQSDIDLVLWLGDFIYSQSSSQPPVPERAHTGPDPVDLASYRQRYTEYRSDPAIQASSAAHPWIALTDDHEVENDYDSSIDPARRHAAFQAWWEHQPTRLAPPAANEAFRQYRSVDCGRLVRLVIVDSRQYADGSTLYGDEQRTWLGDALANPPGWTLLASSVLLGGIVVPLEDEILLPYTLDGYPAERAWLAQELGHHPARLCVSGDLHLGGAVEVTGDPADLAAPVVATEFMAPSLSSGFPDEYRDLLPLIPLANPHIDWLDPGNGWLRLNIAAERSIAEFRQIDPLNPVATPTTSARFEVASDQPAIRRVDG